MKRTRIKIVLRNIRGSMNRFLSIAAIVALGTGFLAGLVSTTPDMEDAMDTYMDDTHWYDIDVKNQLGFSEDDVQRIAAVPGGAQVQSACVTDAVLVSETQSRYTARIFGCLHEGEAAAQQTAVSKKKLHVDWNVAAVELNKLQLVAGRLPQNAKECVIQSPNGYTTALPATGSSLTFLNKETGYAYDSLVVTGVVKSPMFISAESEPSLKGSGSITLGVYVCKDFYARSSYTDVYVAVKNAEMLSTWSAAYKRLVAVTVAALNPIVDEIGKARITLLKTEGNEIKKSLRTVEAVEKSITDDEQLRREQSRRIVSLLQSHGGARALLLARNISATARSVDDTVENDNAGVLQL